MAKWLISALEQETLRCVLKYLVLPITKEGTGDYQGRVKRTKKPKGPTNQLTMASEEALTGQRWDNLSINENNNCKQLKQINYV